MTRRAPLVDLVEAFHVAALVAGLDEAGVLDALGECAGPSSVDTVADSLQLDPVLLRLTLELVSERTDLVVATGDGFVVTERWDALARADVRQYVRAYGRPSLELARVLRDPGLGAALVDRAAHAKSYAGAPTVTALVAALVSQLDLVPVLDVGCGPGSLLIELGRRHTDRIGWGVDANPEMCLAARSAVEGEQLDQRVTIVEADVFAPGQLGTVADPAVRCVVATSVLNGLWHPAPGRPTVASWLAELATVLPGRAVVIADYFGRLGRVPPPWPQRAALHDLVQALSGQGVPPPDHDGWREQYGEAGAQLLHMVEDEERTFFVHLIRLAG